MDGDCDWELDSELTELSSSSEDEYEPKKAPIAKAPTAKEYKIGTVMRPPRTTSYSADWVFTQINEGLIFLDPSYQRDIVWPEAKQIGLIDSLLRNYYIPPVIFAVQRDVDGHERRICIDGKQRLTSIRRFMDGEIFHKDGNKRYWYKQNVKKTLLPTQYRQSFRNKQIVCVEYDDLTNDQEREIFQRVQLGVPLTPAERMQAICGPWPDLVREIRENILGEDGFGDNFEWDRARGREFQCLASVLYLIDNYTTSAKSMAFPGTPQLEKMLQQGTAVSAKLRECTFQTFKVYETLARDAEYSTCFQKPARVSPLEFIMAGVLIFTRRETLSLAQLSSAIAKMRADVRSKHADVRQNNKVSKTMWGFIKKIKVSQLQSDENGDVPAVTALKRSRRGKAPKRKRAESDEEEQHKIVKVSRSVDAQKAKRSNIRTTPMRQASSSSSVAAKKPSLLLASSSSGRSGLRGTRTTVVTDLSTFTIRPADRKRLSSSASVQVKAEIPRRRSTADGADSSRSSAASPVIPASTVSLACDYSNRRSIDRLAAIRKAKSARQALIHDATTGAIKPSSEAKAESLSGKIEEPSTSAIQQKPSASATAIEGTQPAPISSVPSMSSHCDVKMHPAENSSSDPSAKSTPNSGPLESASAPAPACPPTNEDVAPSRSVGASRGPSMQADETSSDGPDTPKQTTDQTSTHSTDPHGDSPSIPVGNGLPSTLTSNADRSANSPENGPPSAPRSQRAEAKRQPTLSPTLPAKPPPAEGARARALSKTTLATPISPSASPSHSRERDYFRSQDTRRDTRRDVRREYDSWRPERRDDDPGRRRSSSSNQYRGRRN